MRKYSSSEEFAAKKAEVASFVAEHNEIASYAKEIEATGAFTLTTATGQYAHLAAFDNHLQLELPQGPQRRGLLGQRR
jgi:hypothetical protein